MIHPVIIYQSAVALTAHTGTVAETSLLSLTLPVLGANDQVSVAIVLSRPASQSVDAEARAALNDRLAKLRTHGLIAPCYA